MKIYKLFKQFLKQVRSKIFLEEEISQNNPLKDKASAADIPDAKSLEQTIHMLERVRSVFDFSPPIQLIPDMRVINRGLTHFHYNTSLYQVTEEDKKVVAEQVNITVQKFSQILPEVELLLQEFDDVPYNQGGIQKMEDIKKQIISALEKVSYDQNSLTVSGFTQEENEKGKYKITFDHD